LDSELENLKHLRGYLQPNQTFLVYIRF